MHVKRIKRAKLSSVFEEDSEDDLPSMLSSEGTSTSTLNLSTEAASTTTAPPDCNLKTLKDIFPNREEHSLRAALYKTNDISFFFYVYQNYLHMIYMHHETFVPTLQETQSFRTATSILPLDLLHVLLLLKTIKLVLLKIHCES